MSNNPVFRESLLAARERLLTGRQEIRAQHEAGSPGIQVSTHLTELLDTVLLDLYEAALADLWPDGSEEFRSQIAIVAHGGYGRRDVAPFSDVDLMILHAKGAESQVFPLASRLLRDLSDARLEVGQSVRTPEQALALAAHDVSVCTSLMESRFLAGSEKLFKNFADKFRHKTQSRYRSLFEAIEVARRKERLQFGETVYLLEPNIKRSRGGLRDLQLLRWLGFARHGTTDPDALQLLGAISKDDQREVRDATEFLLRLRNELHFHSGKSNDVLDRSEQVRLAPLYGHQGTEGILPVEQFMGRYFRHTRAVRSVVGNFVANWRPRSVWLNVWGTIFSHQVEGDYRVTPQQIVATPHGLAKLKTDLAEVLRLCELANAHDKRIAPATWETVRAAAPNLKGEINAETSKQFLALISQPGRLGELLRRLHELGVLEKIIPEFAHARCLLQFNEYHKFTVDEHCILAVQRATEFVSDQGVLGRVYKGIKHKRTLHLALLIHDLGKGYVEDHSDVGLRIAEETARRLRLPLREAETLKFLVHKHLVMSHLAFWRDTSDDQLVVRFAVDEFVMTKYAEYLNAYNANRQEFEELFQCWKMFFAASGEQWDDAALRYKQEHDQRVGQYNMLTQKIHKFVGAMFADKYDFRYDPIQGRRNSGIKAIENAYYTDKELLKYEFEYMDMLLDGAIHIGCLEQYINYDYHPLGNIGFKRAIPGRWIFDSYWKSNNDRDCTKAFKRNMMTIDEAERMYKKLPYSPLVDELKQKEKNLPRDWTEPKMDEYYYSKPMMKDAYLFVECHYMEDVKGERLYGVGADGNIVAFPVTKDKAVLERFADTNGVTDWSTGRVMPYTDKIHQMAVICPDLFPYKAIEKGKPEIQVRRLPVIQYTVDRDISGRNKGIVHDLIDMQKDINYSKSKAQEFLANALGGGIIYDKSKMEETEQEDFDKNHNDSSRSWAITGNTDGFMRRVVDGQLNPEVIRQVPESVDFMDRASGVSTAMESQTQGANEPASLFSMKLRVNQIGNIVKAERLKRVRMEMAEMYFVQAQITYSGQERKFTNKDGSRIAILNKKTEQGVMNKVEDIPRSSVTITEAPDNLTKNLRDRNDLIEINNSIPPEFRTMKTMIIRDMITTTGMSDDKKQEYMDAALNEMYKAKMSNVMEMTGMLSQTEQGKLAIANSQMQLQQLMRNLGTTPQEEPLPEQMSADQENVPEQVSPNDEEPQEQEGLSEPEARPSEKSTSNGFPKEQLAETGK